MDLSGAIAVTEKQTFGPYFSKSPLFFAAPESPLGFLLVQGTLSPGCSNELVGARMFSKGLVFQKRYVV